MGIPKVAPKIYVYTKQPGVANLKPKDLQAALEKGYVKEVPDKNGDGKISNQEIGDAMYKPQHTSKSIEGAGKTTETEPGFKQKLSNKFWNAVKGFIKWASGGDDSIKSEDPNKIMVVK